jgi:hypothetical protein
VEIEKKRKYAITIVKEGRVIEADESDNPAAHDRDSWHPNIVVREMQAEEHLSNDLLFDPAASLKGKDK